MATVDPDPTKGSNKKEAPWTERSASAAHETVDRVADRAATAEGRLREGAAHSAETLAEQREKLQEQVDASLIKARSFAHQNPLATAGIAFAAGVLVTALFRRR